MASLGLSGRERFDVEALPEAIAGGLGGDRLLQVTARNEDGTAIAFPVLVRIDTPQEVLYYRHGGILPLERSIESFPASDPPAY